MTSDKSFTSNSVAVVPARVVLAASSEKLSDFAGKTLCEHAVDQVRVSHVIAFYQPMIRHFSKHENAHWGFDKP